MKMNYTCWCYRIPFHWGFLCLNFIFVQIFILELSRGGQLWFEWRPGGLNRVFFGNSEKFQENLKEIPNFKKIATQLDIQAATAQLWSSDRAQMIFCSSLIQCHHWSQLIIFDVQLECAGQTLIHVFRQLCKTEFKKNSLQLMPHLFASYRVEWIRSGSLNIWRGQYRRCKLRFFEKIILWFFKGFAMMNARSGLKILQYICIIAL